MKIMNIKIVIYFVVVSFLVCFNFEEHYTDSTSVDSVDWEFFMTIVAVAYFEHQCS